MNKDALLEKLLALDLPSPKPQASPDIELTPDQLHQLDREHYDRLADMPIQPLILLDFDNTIADFFWPGVDHYDPYSLGPPLPGARELVVGLVELGTVRIHTQRMTFESLRNKFPARERLRHTIQTWLKANDFPVLDVLLYPHPFCVVYIGDETFNPENYLNPQGLLLEVGRKCKAFKKDKEQDNEV